MNRLPPPTGRRTPGGAGSVSRPILGLTVVLWGALSLAACTGTATIAVAGAHHTQDRSTTTTDAPTTTTSTLPAVTVTETGGRTFLVRVASLAQPLALTIQGWLRSASPGHAFLQEDLTVTNPTSTTESLLDFDDPTTGLASGLQFVMDAADASQSGYGAQCSVDSGYQDQLCPISFPQGVVVDSDSAYRGGTMVTLAPNSNAQIICSYGPVPASLPRSEVSLYFSPGSSGPVDLGG